MSIALTFLAIASTVQLTMHRTPADISKQGGLEPDEVKSIPSTQRGCDGKVSLQRLSYTLDVRPGEKQIVVDVHGEATIEKTASGPLAAPVLIITVEGDPASTLSFPLEASMTAASWESGGTFRERFSSEQMHDAKFWRSVELRCSASPWRVAAVPDGVTYKNGDAAAVDAKVTALKNALKSERGLATAALFEEKPVLLVGPELSEALASDPALKEIKAAKTFVMNPDTGKMRATMRVTGIDQLAVFHAALLRYAGSSVPRIRAATTDEVAAHWPNIGWDINEPFVVADYGAHRLVFDYMDGANLFMIDEVKR